MNFQFKKFENTNSRQEDRITITSTSAFGFPTKFYNDNQLAQYKYAVLYYDAEQKAVGIHFTSDEAEKHKFSILHNKKGYGGSIVATSFFKTYNLDAKIYHGRYNWEKEILPEIGELFIFTLKERQSKKVNTTPHAGLPISEITSVESELSGVPVPTPNASNYAPDTMSDQSPVLQNTVVTTDGGVPERS